MANPSALTISFLEKRPSSAAQTLAGMNPSDAAAFLETVPTRYSVATLGHMSEWSASSVLNEMTPAGAAAALREMDYPSAAAILRLLSEENRAKLLELFPEKLRRDLETSLSFPSDTVGAKMTTAILMLTGDQTAGDAINIMRKSAQVNSESIFIIDENRKLKGAVSASALVRSRPSLKLADIMYTNVVHLSARARVNAIASLAEWDVHSQLPVLSRKKLVIGALSRKTVKGSERFSEGHIVDPSTSITASIASAFFTCAIGLGQLIADIDQPVHASIEKGARS